MTFATIVALASEEVAVHGNVQGQTFIFGVIAFVVFLALGAVTMSYRNVANRHAHKADAYAKAHKSDLTQVGHGHH